MERYIPQDDEHYHSWYEHWHRYYFALQAVHNEYICDIACGEGYGSALLSKHASKVVGVDTDEATIKRAEKTYREQKNLNFVLANAIKTPFDSGTFDCLISFESLEHILDQVSLIKEFKRILKPSGLLMISTPDKHVYSGDDSHNEFHEKELTKDEFVDLLQSEFKYTKLYGQKFQIVSLIEGCPVGNSKVIFKEDLNNSLIQNGPHSSHKYLIMLCSNDKDCFDKLDIPEFHCFSDKENALLNHYEEQVQRLILVDQHNHELLNKIDEQHFLIEHLMSRIGL